MNRWAKSGVLERTFAQERPQQVIDLLDYAIRQAEAKADHPPAVAHAVPDDCCAASAPLPDVEGNDGRAPGRYCAA